MAVDAELREELRGLRSHLDERHERTSDVLTELRVTSGRIEEMVKNLTSQVTTNTTRVDGLTGFKNRLYGVAAAISAAITVLGSAVVNKLFA